ncbi:MAG TPA: hypothetical protein VK196_07115 [Magnetospirillum sp.]|nr:hypothetical protein [Magnetospirillum sp.]
MAQQTASIARPLQTIPVDAAAFFRIAHPYRIAPRLGIALSDRSYLPRTDDLEADWVATVAAPAFARLRQARGAERCRRFCALGTGSGMDALAAIEFLGADVVGLTDLFPDVVDAAAANVAGNLRPDTNVRIHSGAGDLLEPLRHSGVRFDIIYENLPNLPLADDARLEHSQTSSGFVPPRPEPVPKLFQDNLLALHTVALKQARDYLAPGGAVLSTLGGRVPLSVITAMATHAGLTPDIFTYTWKAQVDADAMLTSYAAWQQRGLGPFHFYLVEDLRRAFDKIDPVEAGQRAEDIEHLLAPKRLDAVAALAAHRTGARIGHTVAVLKSELPQ